MAAFNLPSPPLTFSQLVSFRSTSQTHFFPRFPIVISNQTEKIRNPKLTILAINGVNGAPESPKPTRKARKKTTDASPPSSTSPKKPRRSKKAEDENGAVKAKRTRRKAKEEEVPVASAIQQESESESESEVEDEEDEIPYDSPPLVCCFGAAQKDFVLNIKKSDRQMDPDVYSSWKYLQWDPPDFVRAPGGAPSNVAISHVRLGGRAAFMGKVGEDEFGEELVYTMNTERVQTRAVKFDSTRRTAVSYMKMRFEDGKMKAETVKAAAEHCLLRSELNTAVLKEARILHFNSEVLASPSLRSSFFRAMKLFRKHEGLVFFDLNLPLPLWRSRDETRELIKKAWDMADIIEVTKYELEFLLDEEHYDRRRNHIPEYYAENYELSRGFRDVYHYEPEEISPLWHDGIKLLIVTDGTHRIHYYAPSFHGAVVGTEDVLITPHTCDRTGSGDAIVAAIMRKLITHPEMLEDEDVLERQLRFAVAAGIISQWTIGTVRSFPTERAARNLKEQVYVPSMW